MHSSAGEPGAQSVLPTAGCGASAVTVLCAMVTSAEVPMTRPTVHGIRLAPPRNAAVKLVGGRFQRFSAESTSIRRASFITTMRSASASASDWSWVT